LELTLFSPNQPHDIPKIFLLDRGGALAASVLGGVFACVVALISPEFVATLFSREASAAGGSLVRYAAAVGMIWGFFSAAVMAFSILLVTLLHAVRIIRKKTDASGGD
jgi:hypothetical protein